MLEDLRQVSSVVIRKPRIASARTDQLIWTAEIGLAALSFAAGGYIFFTTVMMVVNGWTGIPFWDQWWSGIFVEDQSFVSWLFSQNNEHRIAVPHIIFTIDRELFENTDKFTFGYNIFSQLLLGIIIVTIYNLVDCRKIIWDQIWFIGTTLAILFSAMQYENFLWGFQVAFTALALATVATLATVVLRRPSAWTLAAIIGLESIAVYTLVSGLLVPFLTVALALWLRWPKRYVIVLTAAACGLLGTYFYDYVAPQGASDAIHAGERLGDVLSYFLTLIGLPFGMAFNEAQVSHFKNWDRLCGAGGLALFLIASFSILWRKATRGPSLVFAATALFALGMALMTALGRLKFGSAQAMSSRYSTVMLIFWLSLIAIAALRLRATKAWLRITAMAAILPLVLGLAYHQRSFAANGRHWVLPRLQASTALLANVDDPTALAAIFFDDRLKNRVPFLRDRHLSIFADNWSNWLGTPLADHVIISDRAQCFGGIDRVDPIHGSSPQGWRVGGWGWDTERKTVPRRIIIADGTGQVIGYGLSGFHKTDGREGGDWHGHFAMRLPGSITAYALVQNGHAACSLGHLAVSRNE